MPEQITLSFDPVFALSIAIGITAAVVILKLMAVIASRFDRDITSFLDDIEARLRIKLARDPMWARSIEIAIADGFDEDDDVFEYFAVGRDLVHDETCDLLGPEPDPTDLATICDYMRRAPETIAVHVISISGPGAALLEDLAGGADMLASKAELPQTISSLMQPVPCKDASISTVGADLESDLVARFGPAPDLPTLAGLALALESHPRICAARITLDPQMHRSQKLLTDLTGRDPKTGLPFISTAELDPEGVV